MYVQKKFQKILKLLRNNHIKLNYYDKLLEINKLKKR